MDKTYEIMLFKTVNITQRRRVIPGIQDADEVSLMSALYAALREFPSYNAGSRNLEIYIQLTYLSKAEVK